LEFFLGFKILSINIFHILFIYSFIYLFKSKQKAIAAYTLQLKYDCNYDGPICGVWRRGTLEEQIRMQG